MKELPHRGLFLPVIMAVDRDCLTSLDLPENGMIEQALVSICDAGLIKILNSPFNFGYFGQWSHFIIPTLVDFSCCLWIVKSEKLAVFLLKLEHLPLSLESEGAKLLTNRKTLNVNVDSRKWILIGQRVLKTSRWNLEGSWCFYTNRLLKKNWIGKPLVWLA